MPKTAARERWVTCVQLVYSRWVGLGKSSQLFHPPFLSPKTVGKNPEFSAEKYAHNTPPNAHLFCSDQSVNPQLSTPSTGLITTTTTYIN